SDPPTMARTPRSRTSCRPLPILVLVLAIARNGRACLARPPFPDSSVLPSLVLPRLRNCGYRPDSCRSIPGEPACRPWWRKSNRDRWSIPGLAGEPALPPGSAVPGPPDTGAPCDEPVLLPLTARVECGSPWPHSLPRSCHRPTGACPESSLVKVVRDRFGLGHE